MHHVRTRGFTMIEMLVVVAIIGALAALIIANLLTARSRARDTRRVADMEQIQRALLFYYDDTRTFPDPGAEPSASFGGWDVSHCDEDSNGKYFIEDLEQARYIEPMPSDPVSGKNCDAGATYFYRYTLYGPGSGGCDATLGSFYVLTINQFETGGNTANARAAFWNSPGCSCGSNGEWNACQFTSG